MRFQLLRVVPLFLLLLLLLAFAGCGGNSTKVCSSTNAAGVCGCSASKMATTEASNTCVVPAYLYAASITGQLSAYPIDLSSGALGVPVSTAGPVAPLGMAQLDQQFLYASDRQMATGNSSVDAWSINLGTGALTPVPGSPFALGPLTFPGGMVVDNAGPFLYIADEFKIDALKVDLSTGALTTIAGSPFASESNTFLAIDPMNRFLFAVDDAPEGSIVAFTINSTDGTLTVVPGSPFPTVPGSTVNTLPFQVVVDPTGSFVYTALEATNQVAGFSISSTGALTAIPGSPFAAGGGPFQLAIGNGLLYVANALDKTISGYSIDPTTGALTPLSGSPFPFAAAALTISRSFLYASGSAEIQAFSIDGATGALTPVAGSPFQGSGASVMIYVQ